jgi:ATP-binding cassette subfamily F protein 3
VREQRPATRDDPRTGPPQAEQPPLSSAKARSKEQRRAAAEASQRRSQELAPLKARLAEVETEIEKAEARIQGLTDQMANPELYRDGERVREVARERKALQDQVASLYGKWEELAMRIEHARAEDA